MGGETGIEAVTVRLIKHFVALVKISKTMKLVCEKYINSDGNFERINELMCKILKLNLCCTNYQ